MSIFRFALVGAVLACGGMIRALTPPPKMIPSLSGKVALVTGASRGIGRGIALGLGESKATVYITGRSEKSLTETAAEVDKRGGVGIPVVCDHSDDESIRKLFDRIEKEQPEGLDVVVHNAYPGVESLFNNADKKFWEQGADWYDKINHVGLRSHFLSSQLAVPLMLKGKGATKENPRLMVTVSSVGGSIYFLDVAYGMGKAGKDKMAHDMAQELKDKNIASVSLWPGAVQTEFIKENVLTEKTEELPPAKAMTVKAFANGESTIYSGFAVAALAKDQNVMSMTGKVLITEDLGARYGFREEDGTIPHHLLAVRSLFHHADLPGVAKFIPPWVKLPKVLFSLVTGKL